MSKDIVPFSKSPYNWDKSIKIVSRDLSSEDFLGFYDFGNREVVLDFNLPDSGEVTDTLAHEISHQRLGHKSLRTLTDGELGNKFRGLMALTRIEDFGDLSLREEFQRFAEYLDEIEVRIYQAESGLFQAKDQKFRFYLEDQLLKFSEHKTKRALIYVALQAISNMQKKGVISKSKAKSLRRNVYGLVRRFRIKIGGPIQIR